MSHTSKPAVSKEGAPPAKAKKAELEASTRAGNPGARNEQRLGAAATAVDAWSRASQIAVIGLFVIALLWCCYVAQPVIVPVLLAWAIATIVLPIVTWMHARGVPRVLAAILVTLLLFLITVSLLGLLSTPVAYWLGRATEIGALIKQKLQTMSQPLTLLDELQKALSAIGSGESTLRVEAQQSTLVGTIFSILTPAVSQFILFLGALVFYLIYQKRLRSTVVYLLRDREMRLATLRTLSDIDENMTTYFGTFTIVNICLGLVTVALTWLVGLPNPLLWGVLAALLNYIPYIGPAIVVATLAVVGLVTYPTLGEVAVAPLIYIAMVTIEGQFITPAFMGRQLELNPFAVFLAIAFCTWFWGPIGAFLAVPLLMALTVTLGNVVAEEPPDLPD
ncbi:MAG TPA: AI-2E family transporter [Hyphomicrobiaceae bacterium]|jgi:predicted PurR-regulated permease PerM|nr:AI-2E family transporter [Hyphomicrobiaceae bacterium]